MNRRVIFVQMSQKQLLIVDDSDLILYRLKNLLEGLPGLAEIDTASSYTEALERLSVPVAPDIVLLDINLPAHNGIDLLRHVRRHHPEMIVIMLSNQAGKFYRDLCRHLGAAFFIDKSTEFELIPTILSSLCTDAL